MIPEKSKKAISAFDLYDLYPREITVTHGPAFDLRQIDKPPPSYTRFNWNVEHVGVMETADQDDGTVEYLFRYRMDTMAELDGGVEGEPSPEEDLPEERILGAVIASFNVEYETKQHPDEIDAVALCYMTMVRIPLDVFPYWRETLQGMTTRTRLPVPTLPRYRPPAVPKVLARAKALAGASADADDSANKTGTSPKRTRKSPQKSTSKRGNS